MHLNQISFIPDMPAQATETPSHENECVYLRFDLHKNDDFLIEQFWKDHTSDSSVKLATILFLVHSGKLLHKSLDNIKEYAAQNEENKDFIDRVIAIWTHMIEEEEANKITEEVIEEESKPTDDRPVMLPSQVLKQKRAN